MRGMHKGILAFRGGRCRALMVEYKELEKAIEAERATKSCGYTGRDVAEKVCEFCKWIAKNQEDIMEGRGNG